MVPFSHSLLHFFHFSTFVTVTCYFLSLFLCTLEHSRLYSDPSYHTLLSLSGQCFYRLLRYLAPVTAAPMRAVMVTSARIVGVTAVTSAVYSHASSSLCSFLVSAAAVADPTTPVVAMSSADVTAVFASVLCCSFPPVP